VRKLVYLMTVMILVATSSAATIKALAPVPQAKLDPALTISIDEIHRTVDTSSLPKLEFPDLWNSTDPQ
jgi:hypothetical protein